MPRLWLEARWVRVGCPEDPKEAPVHAPSERHPRQKRTQSLCLPAPGGLCPETLSLCVQGGDAFPVVGR